MELGQPTLYELGAVLLHVVLHLEGAESGEREVDAVEAVEAVEAVLGRGIQRTCIAICWSKPRNGMERIMTVVSKPTPCTKPAHSSAT